jgi:hypothetical protein
VARELSDQAFEAQHNQGPADRTDGVSRACFGTIVNVLSFPRADLESGRRDDNQ